MEKSNRNFNIRGLVIDLALHFAITVSLAVLFRVYTGGWIYPALAVCGGILIDLDHFFDYFRHYGFKLNIADFFGHTYLASGKMFVPLHSWELVVILWTLSLWVKWVIPVASGITLHLMVDQFLSHRKDPLIYFITYRLYHRFELNKLDAKHKRS